MRASAEPYTWSGRSSMATRLSSFAIRSYSSQSALRRFVVALKMCRRAMRRVSGSVLPEWVNSALPSNTRNPDHQSACEIRTEQRGSRSRFLNFIRVSVIEIPTPPSRGYTVTMLSCGIPLRRNEVSTPCGLSWMNCSIWGASWDGIGIYCAPWWTRRPLLLSAANHDPARYASAAIPGRIGAHVIGAFVHDEGAPVGTEQGGRSRFERHPRIRDLQMASARGLHGDVGEVARVRPFRVRRAVLGLGRVEMRPGGLERGWIASPHRVDVDALGAGREIPEIDQNTDAVALLQEHGAAHHAAGGIPEGHAGHGRRQGHPRDIRQPARRQGERERDDPPSSSHDGRQATRDQDLVSDHRQADAPIRCAMVPP